MTIRTIIHLLFTTLFLSLLSCESSHQHASSTQESETSSPSAKSEVSQPSSGLALYTLRDTMSKNPKQVLKEVADIGYTYIEAAGYEDGKFYGMSPIEFKNYLDEIGLQPLSTHHGSVSLDNADQMIADAVAAGFTYFVIPVPPMGHFAFDPRTMTLSMSEEVEEVMNIINTIAEKCSEAGIECLYHNHDFEFKKNKKGIVPMDYFIEHSDPQHLNFQIDLYWATKAGADPVSYFQKAPGRFKTWHVKDMDAEGRFAPVGMGSIDFASILEQKELAGMKSYFVEQDMTFGQTPMEAIKISYQALGEIGFK